MRQPIDHFVDGLAFSYQKLSRFQDMICGLPKLCDLLTAVVDYDLSEAEREVIRTFDRADAAFLTAARDAVAERYGSVDAFLTQALGVGAAERAALRARYLTAE